MLPATRLQAATLANKHLTVWESSKTIFVSTAGSLFFGLGGLFCIEGAPRDVAFQLPLLLKNTCFFPVPPFNSVHRAKNGEGPDSPSTAPGCSRAPRGCPAGKTRPALGLVAARRARWERSVELFRLVWGVGRVMLTPDEKNPAYQCGGVFPCKCDESTLKPGHPHNINRGILIWGQHYPFQVV